MGFFFHNSKVDLWPGKRSKKNKKKESQSQDQAMGQLRSQDSNTSSSRPKVRVELEASPPKQNARRNTKTPPSLSPSTFQAVQQAAMDSREDGPPSASAFEAPWSPSTARMGPALSTRVKNSSLHGTRASDKNDTRLTENMVAALSGKKSREDLRPKKSLDYSSSPSPPARANTTKQRSTTASRAWESVERRDADNTLTPRPLLGKTSQRSLRGRKPADGVSANVNPVSKFSKVSKRRSEVGGASPKMNRDDPPGMRPSTADGKNNNLPQRQPIVQKTSTMVTQGTQTSTANLHSGVVDTSADMPQQTHTRIAGRSRERPSQDTSTQKAPSYYNSSSSSRDPHSQRIHSDLSRQPRQTYRHSRSSTGYSQEYRRSRDLYRRRSPSPPQPPRSGRPYPVLSMSLQQRSTDMNDGGGGSGDEQESLENPVFRYGPKSPKTNSIETARRDINQLMESVAMLARDGSPYRGREHSYYNDNRNES